MNTTLIAGALAGVAGLMVFLIIHHFWISPIWFILPIGLVLAAAGGLAVDWAYGELLPNLPPRPWTAPAMIALIAVILLPAIILAETRSPLFSLASGGARLVVSTWRAAAIFILELLLTATLAGVLAGWFIGRSGRAALATAVAGFISPKGEIVHRQTGQMTEEQAQKFSRQWLAGQPVGP